jgi:5-methylcytosine-specific restriction enzyme B
VGIQQFTVGGVSYAVNRELFEERLNISEPEPIRKYSVEVSGRAFPVKQAVALGLKAPKAGFQTQEAFRVLRRLGFDPLEHA